MGSVSIPIPICFVAGGTHPALAWSDKGSHCRLPSGTSSLLRGTARFGGSHARKRRNVRSCDRTGISAGWRRRCDPLLSLFGAPPPPPLESPFRPTKAEDDERAQGDDHRHHRPGRQLPGRAPARKGVRGARPRAPQQLLQHLAHRPRARPAGPALRRPRRPEQPRAHAGQRRPRRDLQPRRAEPREGARSRCRSTRRTSPALACCACSTRCASSGSKARVYQAGSSEMYGLVQETPQTEKTPFHPRSPYGVAKVFGHWIDDELPRELRDARLQRHPVQPRVAAARRELRHPQDHEGAGRDQAGPTSSELRLGNLDAKRDWGYARGLRRGDVADAAAGAARRLRDRHGRDALRARVPGGGLLATSASNGSST